jgi:hypothetical protein
MPQYIYAELVNQYFTPKEGVVISIGFVAPPRIELGSKV